MRTRPGKKVSGERVQNHVYPIRRLTPSLTVAAALALIAAAPAPSHAGQAGLSGTVMALAKRCAPNVHPLTMAYLVTAESASSRVAIGVNGGYRLPRRPTNEREAIEAIRWLDAHGYNYDVGYGQVNSSNFDWLGVTGENLLDGCTNLRASSTVLTGCYAEAVKTSGEGQAALRHALSCYNTGSQSAGFANGYVKKVVKVATKANVLQIPALLGDGQAAAAVERTPARSSEPATASKPDKMASEFDGLPDAFRQADEDAFAHPDPDAFYSAAKANVNSIPKE